MFSSFHRKKNFPVCLFFLTSCLAAFSQKIVEVKYLQDSKGGYVFSCFNTAYCNYILDLGFTSFGNLKCDQPLPFHGEVKPGYSKLFTLSVIDPQIPVQFKYNSGYEKGCIRPEVNRDFTYLFPISPGKQAQVYEMTPDKNADSASEWYVLRLRMKAGDTIYAARKGIVTELQDQNAANDAGLASAGSENYIEIVQADCSFAHYGILKKNGSFVHPGQVVQAGQPIALVGGDAYGRGSDIRFSVFYYESEEKSSSSWNGKRKPVYLALQIWTKKNGKGKLKHGAQYISEFPAAILNLEAPKLTGKKSKLKKK